MVHPLLDGIPRLDPALLAEAAELIAADPLLASADLLVAPEAMGIPLTTAVSLRTGIPFTIARKRPYGLPGEVRVPVRTGYGHSVLSVCDVRPQDRVVVLDALVSTGGTLEALLGALRPQCALLGAIVVWDKSGRCQELGQRMGVPVRSVVGPRPSSDEEA